MAAAFASWAIIVRSAQLGEALAVATEPILVEVETWQIINVEEVRR